MKLENTNLINYYPQFLKNIKEFNVINDIENREIDYLKKNIQLILKEIIVNTAEDYGLDRYEKIYGISKTTTDIEQRRQKILYKMNDRLPYSFNWLKRKLNGLVGEENYEIFIDYNKYVLNIKINKKYLETAKLLKNGLREQIPANMILDIETNQTESCNSYIGGIVRTGDFIEICEVKRSVTI